jgi:hypothetical protein
LALGGVLLVATGQDDAYITYWAAHTLATTGEIVNYAGDHVEQSSSLLQTAILALLARTTRAPLPALGYWLAVGAGLLATVRAPSLCRVLGVRPSAWIALWVGTVPIYLYWWFSGMETTIQAWLFVEVAIVGASLVDGRRPPSLARVAAVTGAFVTVRPEAAFVLGAALVGGLGASRWLHADDVDEAAARRRLARWLAFVFLALGALIAFRLAAFGLPFPQPVYAKVGGGIGDTFLGGLRYLAKLVRLPLALPVSVAVLGLPFLLWQERGAGGDRRAARFVLLLIAAQTAFVVAVGGDWMLGSRFFAPIAPIAVAVAARGLARLDWSQARRQALLAGGLGLQLVGLVGLAMASTGQPLWRTLAQAPVDVPSLHWSEAANRVHRRDLVFADALGRVVDALLQEQETVTLLSRQAGMVMFHTALGREDRIEFVDLYGLTSRHVSALVARQDLSPSEVGVRADLADWLESGEQPVPDVIFDVWPTGPEVRALGYKLAYAQNGVAHGWGIPPLRRDYTLYQYLAVRDELWERLPPLLRGVTRDLAPDR